MKKLLKPQNVRLVDIFLLGPFMILFGIMAMGVLNIFKIIMIVSGIGTIIYNGRNYLINEGIIKR